MNTVKRWLAGFLSFAMIFTSAAFTNLGAVTGFAAEISNFNLTVKNGSESLVNQGTDLNYEYETVANYDDAITLSAASTKKAGAKVTEGEVVYKWAVLDGYGDDAKELLVSNEASLTFVPSDYPVKGVQEAYVRLNVYQNYTKDGAKSVDEKEADIYIDFRTKKITTDMIASPELFDVYLKPATPPATSMKLSEVDASIAGDDLSGLIKAYDTTYGTWSVATSGETVVNLGNNDIKVTFTLNALKYEAQGSDWDTTTPAAPTITRTVNLKVLSATDHVTKVAAVDADDNELTNVDLIYNERLAGDANYALDVYDEGSMVCSGYVNGTDNQPMRSDLEFTYSEEGVVAVENYNKETGTFTVKATGIPKAADGKVTVWATAASGAKTSFTVTIYKGIAVDDVDFAEIPETYQYEKGKTVADIFDIDNANYVRNATRIAYLLAEKIDSVADPDDYRQEAKKYGHRSYNAKFTEKGSIKPGTEIINGKFYNFAGTYTLNDLEKGLYINNGKWTYGLSGGDTKGRVITNDEGTHVRKFFSTTVTGKALTEEYIQGAVNHMKLNDVILNGGEIEYGTDLNNYEHTVDGYPGVVLTIYKDGKNGKEDIESGEYLTELGKVTKYYVVAEAYEGYTIPRGVNDTYDIEFTVVKANLKVPVYYNIGTGNPTLAGSAIHSSEVKSLTVDPYVNERVYSAYNYTYEWLQKDGDDWITVAKTDMYAPTSGTIATGKTYKCKVTATLKAGEKVDPLAETVVETAEIKVLPETDIEVYGLSKGTVGTTDFASEPYDTPGWFAWVFKPTEIGLRVRETKSPAPTANKFNTITLKLLDNKGEVVEEKEFEGGTGFFKDVTFTPSDTLDAGRYNVWIYATTEMTTTTVDANNVTRTSTSTDEIEARIGTYSVAPLFVDGVLSAAVRSFEGEENIFVEKDGKESIVYGEKPSDKLAYEVEFGAFNWKPGIFMPVTPGSGDGSQTQRIYTFTAEETERICNLINANYNIEITTAYDTVSEVGEKDLKVTVTKKNTFDNTNLWTNDYFDSDNYDVAPIQVTKAPLTLAPEKEAYEWVIGGDNEDIKGVYKGFVNGDDAETLGLGSDYEVFDGEKKINISNIKPGEYTVQMKATSETANYAIEAKTAKLTVLSPVQKDADEFIKKIESTDLTDKAAVDALLAEYDKLSKGAQALVDESDAKKALDAAKTDLDAVAAAQAAVAKATAAGATDADIADAQAKLAALTDAQKAIYGKDALDKATADVKKAADGKQAAKDQEAANKVIEMLSKITDSSSQADAKAAVDAYNALTAAQKALVDANATAKANLAKAQTKANTPDKTKTTFTYKNSKKTIKASKVKKKAQKFTFKAKAKSGGKVTYKKASGSKKVTISKKGKVTVKKGTKKGTYKIKVKCTAAAKGNFLKTTVKKQITVKVK